MPFLPSFVFLSSYQAKQEISGYGCFDVVTSKCWCHYEYCVNVGVNVDVNLGADVGQEVGAEIAGSGGNEVGVWIIWIQ